MRRIRLLVIFMIVSYTASGQLSNPDNKPLAGNEFPKLYLQTDRNNYLSGDTVWAKGYFSGNLNTSRYSLTLELADLKKRKLITTRTFLSSKTAAAATIVLPTDLETGTYLMRAYSQNVKEQGETLFTKLIKVYGVFNKNRNEPEYKKELVFYPEGGHLIIGDSNRVAFKFADKLGKPFNVAGKIISSSGKFVTSFKSIHNGMGVFALKPQAGESYFAIIDHEKDIIKHPLPEPVNNGIVLNIQNDSSSIFFSIKTHSQDDIAKPLFFILQMEKQQVYNTLLKGEAGLFKGSVSTQDFPSGVARLCVFNKDTQLLAERLCFIDNKEYVLPANLTISLVNKNPRGENLFSLDLNEPVPGTFAVGVTDADIEKSDSETQNIYSTNLLTCYLKDRVYNAGAYFDGEYKNYRELLDLVMLTGSWAPAKWEEQTKDGPMRRSVKETLSGTVLYKGTNKPYANSTVLLTAISEDDSTTQTAIITTNNKGKFENDAITFFGRNRLLFSPSGQKHDYIDIVLDTFYKEPLQLPTPEIISVNEEVAGNITATPYDSLINSKEYLENVTVKNRLKSQTQKLEQRYTTGRFRELYGEVHDLTDIGKQYGNILDYLIMRYPDIKIETDNVANYHITARNINGTFAEANIYLNEKSVFAAEQLYAISPEDVAIIKVVQNMDFNEKGPVPAIAIYTRKGRDFTASGNNYALKYYESFCKPKEFYNPVYQSGLSNDNFVDNRITLFWNPRAATSKRISFIPLHFYNNDYTKTFRITIEGVTEEGKLLYFVKTL